jgi:uncharacterized protein
MTGVLLAVLFALGVLGALLYILWSRGWMRNGYFRIGTSVLVAVAVFLIFQTAGSAIYLLATSGDLTGDDARALLGSTSLAQLVILIGGTLLLIKATDQDFETSLRLEGVKQTPVGLYLLAVPIIYLAQYVGGIVSIFWMRLLDHLPMIDKLKALEESQEAMITQIIQASSLGEFVFVFLGIAIVPAIAEEIFFRGFLQTNIERSGYRRSRPYVALVLASVIFASVHFSPFKFPGLLALGLAMGYMSYRTNNLLVGSIAHAVNNGSIVLIMLMSPGMMEAADPEAAVKANNLTDMALLGALALFSMLLAGAIALFHNLSEPIEARHYAEQEVRATTAYFDALEMSERGAFETASHNELNSGPRNGSHETSLDRSHQDSDPPNNI